MKASKNIARMCASKKAGKQACTLFLGNKKAKSEVKT